MERFCGVPVYVVSDANDAREAEVFRTHFDDLELSDVVEAIALNRLVLLCGVPRREAGAFFGRLVDYYGLRESYALQMQYVVNLIESRKAIDGMAVTVNERAAFEIIQPHSEGDSTSPLDLFALHCSQNSDAGGENVLSLVNQRADCSLLRAKEKAIVGRRLSTLDINRLRRKHLDAREVLSEFPAECRVVEEHPNGCVIVHRKPLVRGKSVVNGEELITLWDNVTVHDHAFHRHQFELLKHLDILHLRRPQDGYERYMHVESDSAWGPADTDSGTLQETAAQFSRHVLVKLAADELLVFHNRAWTHAVNNWPPHEKRTLCAMYA